MFEKIYKVVTFSSAALTLACVAIGMPVALWQYRDARKFMKECEI